MHFLLLRLTRAAFAVRCATQIQLLNIAPLSVTDALPAALQNKVAAPLAQALPETVNARNTLDGYTAWRLHTKYTVDTNGKGVACNTVCKSTTHKAHPQHFGLPSNKAIGKVRLLLNAFERALTR